VTANISKTLFPDRVSVFSCVSGEQQSVATHRPREDGLTHPAHTSRSNLADALGKHESNPPSSQRKIY
jgi:hypothetical protein